MIDLKTLGHKRGLRKNHKKGIAAGALDRKRAEAKVRQDEYNSLTLEQRVDRLDSGGYRATKQRAKLDYAMLLKRTVDRVQSKA